MEAVFRHMIYRIDRIIRSWSFELELEGLGSDISHKEQ